MNTNIRNKNIILKNHRITYLINWFHPESTTPITASTLISSYRKFLKKSVVEGLAFLPRAIRDIWYKDRSA